MGSPILLERCRMAGAVKNDPGQWKFIGIEGMCLRLTTSDINMLQRLPIW